MKIYHGSKCIIEKPIFKGSNPKNDYGAAFYTTLNLDAAKIWACKSDTLGIVNEYEISDKTYNNFKILDLTDKTKYTILNWLAILMHFRETGSKFEEQNKIILNWLEKYYIDVESYDVVIGYRADDAYFRFPIHFINTELSVEDLDNVFLSGCLEIQYTFMSEKAIKALKFKKTIKCEEKFIGVYFEIVKKLTKQIDSLAHQQRNPNKTYILDLMRKENE